MHDIMDENGILRGQDYEEQEITLPVCIASLRGLSAATISRLYAGGGTIPDDDDEPHDARQAIDRMLWAKRREQERAQAELPRW